MEITASDALARIERSCELPEAAANEIRAIREELALKGKFVTLKIGGKCRILRGLDVADKGIFAVTKRTQRDKKSYYDVHHIPTGKRSYQAVPLKMAIAIAREALRHLDLIERRWEKAEVAVKAFMKAFTENILRDMRGQVLEGDFETWGKWFDEVVEVSRDPDCQCKF